MHVIKGQTHQRVVWLVTALEECDTEIIVMNPCLMPFKVIGRLFKVMLSLIPLTLAFGDFSAQNIIGKQNQRSFCHRNQSGYLVHSRLSRSQIVQSHCDAAHKHQTGDALGGNS